MRLMEELKELAEQDGLKKSVIERQKLEINVLREENQQLTLKNGKFGEEFMVCIYIYVYIYIYIYYPFEISVEDALLTTTISTDYRSLKRQYNKLR